MNATEAPWFDSFCGPGGLDYYIENLGCIDAAVQGGATLESLVLPEYVAGVKQALLHRHHELTRRHHEQLGQLLAVALHDEPVPTDKCDDERLNSLVSEILMRDQKAGLRPIVAKLADRGVKTNQHRVRKMPAYRLALARRSPQPKAVALNEATAGKPDESLDQLIEESWADVASEETQRKYGRRLKV